MVAIFGGTLLDAHYNPKEVAEVGPSTRDITEYLGHRTDQHAVALSRHDVDIHRIIQRLMGHQHMSDMNEGDTPLKAKSCVCGLIEQEGHDKCPDCGKAWPEHLISRSVYDGKPAMREEPGQAPMTFMLVMEQEGGCDYAIDCGTKIEHLPATTIEDAEADALRIIDEVGGFDEHEGQVDAATIYQVRRVRELDIPAITRQRNEAERAEDAEQAEADDLAELARLTKKYPPSKMCSEDDETP